MPALGSLYEEISVFLLWMRDANFTTHKIRRVFIRTRCAAMQEEEGFEHDDDEWKFRLKFKSETFPFLHTSEGREREPR